MKPDLDLHELTLWRAVKSPFVTCHVTASTAGRETSASVCRPWKHKDQQNLNQLYTVTHLNPLFLFYERWRFQANACHWFLLSLTTNITEPNQNQLSSDNKTLKTAKTDLFLYLEAVETSCNIQGRIRTRYFWRCDFETAQLFSTNSKKRSSWVVNKTLSNISVLVNK